MPDTTIGALFLVSYRKNPNSNFIIQANGKKFTYAESAQHIAYFLEALDHHHVQKGDYVISYLDQTLPGIFLTLACALRGAIFSPISPTFTLNYIKDVANRIGAKVIFSMEDFPTSKLDMPVVHAFVSDDLPDKKNTEVTIDSLSYKIEPHDIFMIQPTSGSTGEPKLVLRSHSSVLQYAKHLGPQLTHSENQRPRFLVVAALTHALGFHMFSTALALGAELALTSEIDIKSSLLEVRYLEPSVLPMTPRVLRSFCRQKAELQDNSPVFGYKAQYLLSAGAACDSELMKLVQSQGILAIEFYGSSETSILALTPRDAWKEGYAGKLLPGIEIKRAEDGELLVKTPGQMKGYFGAAELTSSSYDDNGYYKTGDIGEISSDGYVRILGRKKDAFGTTEGSAIFPERIENKIESLRWVHQAALSGAYIHYLTAIIVVDPKMGVRSMEPDGFLDKKNFAQLYQQARMDLAKVNDSLEPLEKIHRFSLFSRPFPPGLYAQVGPGKIRRNRQAFNAILGRRLAELYSPNIQSADLAVVPGTEKKSDSQSICIAPNERTILIVDDISAMAYSLALTLEKFGYKRVHVESSAKEAMEFIQKSQGTAREVGLIISDWNMPEMDGFEFYNKLRSSPDIQPIPFIMATADGEFAKALGNINAGVAYVMVKPIDETKLQKILQTVLPIKRALSKAA